jgi:hypothetical protein
VAGRTEESLERIVAVPFELAEVAAAASVGARLVRINAPAGDERVAAALSLAERAARGAAAADG